ncbi:RsmB/NOP family class I SAM-dependent RNA methyltransferase [Aestuariimicrobium ganziense]|uniref:RsmB/NOP family class I SAM-dependent RNA methyltransferase n=1 Tax=Aestuariimicrobium ganziense TaxID=2773677 RepID=UPI001940460E|nr:RsmB/NOP family class I SAM-dependent RNA methyltransferase [Aestuariimicrobium ganziense]
MSSRPPRAPKVPPALLAAHATLLAVDTANAYANLALADQIDRVPERQRPFATELTFGCCRLLGTHDRIIEAASGRRADQLDAPLRAVLRLTSHRLLVMDAPDHAVVNEAVDLARRVAGHRVTGLVNAVARKIARRSLDQWLDVVTAGLPADEAWAVRHHHPRWIADVHRGLLGDDEASLALAANNQAARPTLVVRPGLADRDSVEGAEPTRWSPWGFTSTTAPGELRQVRGGTVGVQDEGSQLVALALARVADHEQPWLDLCAGPGGKAALLTGLAREAGTWLLANEAQPHRAALVRQGLRAYPHGWQVVAGDGTRPAWRPDQFAAVMADVPCTGLGALRRRPEARWRKSPDDLPDLVDLQQSLLASALESVTPGGVVAYVTCSPHPDETVGAVRAVIGSRTDVKVLDAPAVLAEVSDCRRTEDERFVQLWPHRHGTDAMFLALLRRT